MCDDCGCGHTAPSGEITHFFKKPMAAVARLAEDLKVGDRVRIKGSTTEFTMTIAGMRNEAEKEIQDAKAGDLVAFVTPEVARPGDIVWLTMREVAE